MKTTLALSLQPDQDPVPMCVVLLELAKELDLLQPSFEMTTGRARAAADKIPSLLQKRRDRYFVVTGEKMRLNFCGNLGDDEQVKLMFTSLRPEVSLLDQWLPKLERAAGCIFACLMDPEWAHWQNEVFLNKFELMGRSTKGLKTKRHPDLGYDIVDTSANPGRSVSRDSYTEELGHEMWLMPLFWKVTGAKRASIERQLSTRELPGNILGVTLSNKPFGDRNLPSEDTRRLLFP
jgi:hypothetical protein